MDCLVDLATVIPCLSFHYKDGKRKIQKYGTPIIGKPVFSDLFWLLERKCFDRSGWEELVIENNTTSNDITRDNMQSFIKSNFIAAAQVEQEKNEELQEGDIKNFKIFGNEEEGEY